MSKRRKSRNHNRRLTPVYADNEPNACMTEEAWRDRGFGLKRDARGFEIAYRLNVTQVDWLRRKIEEEHAGLGK